MQQGLIIINTVGVMLYRTPDDGHWTQDAKHHTISSQVSYKSENML